MEIENSAATTITPAETTMDPVSAVAVNAEENSDAKQPEAVVPIEFDPTFSQEERRRAVLREVEFNAPHVQKAIMHEDKRFFDKERKPLAGDEREEVKFLSYIAIHHPEAIASELAERAVENAAPGNRETATPELEKVVESVRNRKAQFTLSGAIGELTEVTGQMRRLEGLLAKAQARGDTRDQKSLELELYGKQKWAERITQTLRGVTEQVDISLLNEAGVVDKVNTLAGRELLPESKPAAAKGEMAGLLRKFALKSLGLEPVSPKELRRQLALLPDAPQSFPEINPTANETKVEINESPAEVTAQELIKICKTSAGEAETKLAEIETANSDRLDQVVTKLKGLAAREVKDETPSPKAVEVFEKTFVQKPDSVAAQVINDEKLPSAQKRAVAREAAKQMACLANRPVSRVGTERDANARKINWLSIFLAALNLGFEATQILGKAMTIQEKRGRK